MRVTRYNATFARVASGRASQWCYGMIRIFLKQCFWHYIKHPSNNIPSHHMTNVTWWDQLLWKTSNRYRYTDTDTDTNTDSCHVRCAIRFCTLFASAKFHCDFLFFVSHFCMFCVVQCLIRVTSVAQSVSAFCFCQQRFIVKLWVFLFLRFLHFPSCAVSDSRYERCVICFHILLVSAKLHCQTLRFPVVFDNLCCAVSDSHHTRCSIRFRILFVSAKFHCEALRMPFCIFSMFCVVQCLICVTSVAHPFLTPACVSKVSEATPLACRRVSDSIHNNTYGSPFEAAPLAWRRVSVKPLRGSISDVLSPLWGHASDVQDLFEAMSRTC